MAENIDDLTIAFYQDDRNVLKELKKIVRDTTFEYHRNRNPLRVNLEESELNHLVNNLRGLTRRQAGPAADQATMEMRWLTRGWSDCRNCKRVVVRRAGNAGVFRRNVGIDLHPGVVESLTQTVKLGSCAYQRKIANACPR